MYQTIAWYSDLGALPRALLLFPLGLVIGSFSTMLRHRIPLRQSIIRPGSHCPACGHGLRAADLVPVVSYLWLRGRCRYCQMRIPGRYLVLEVLNGLLVMAIGAALGWGPAFLELAVAPLAVAFAVSVRLLKQRPESGFTLIEVLVAMGLLVVVAVPMFQVFTNNSKGLSTYQRQYALNWATEVVENREAQAVAYGSNGSWNWLPSSPHPQDCRPVGNIYLALDEIPVSPGNATEALLIKQETVLVSFWEDSGCVLTQLNVRPVRMVAFLEHIP